MDPVPVVVAQRVDPAATPDTAEISALARAAGYQVIEEIGMVAEFDSQYGLATEIVSDLAERVPATEATTVVVDDKLTPHQTYNLVRRFPADTEIVGRHRLILDVLAKRATTKEAQLQVERAELAYERRRLKARGDLARRDEDAPACTSLETYDPTREDELKDWISRLRDELDAIVQEQRREASFDLVALAGYTNAGKSTLFQRLERDIELNRSIDTFGFPEDPRFCNRGLRIVAQHRPEVR